MPNLCAGHSTIESLYAMFDQGLRDESQRLRVESQRVRAEALQSRISAALTFCDFAERQARWESAAAARHTLSKAWHTIEEVDRHIREPHHVDEKAAAVLWEHLRRLRERASKLQSELEKQE